MPTKQFASYRVPPRNYMQAGDTLLVTDSTGAGDNISADALVYKKQDGSFSQSINWTQIASVTPTPGTTNIVTFSNIPQTYSDLWIDTAGITMSNPSYKVYLINIAEISNANFDASGKLAVFLPNYRRPVGVGIGYANEGYDYLSSRNIVFSWGSGAITSFSIAFDTFITSGTFRLMAR